MGNEGTDRPTFGRSTLVGFAAAVLLGGSNFIAVRFSNRELDPFWGAGLRFALAGVIFVLCALFLRLHWPRGRQLLLTIAYGLVSFAGSYALLYWALVRVTAGAATVVLALVPLLTLLLAVAQKMETLTRSAVIGSLLALAGLGWMAFGPGGLVIPLAGLVAMLAAALVMSESVILGKRVSGNHPVMTNAVGMTLGAAALLILSALLGETWELPGQVEVAWSLAYLVLFGSVGLFVLSLMLARRMAASALSYLFVLFPVVTMALGAILADEPITIQGVIGAVLVITGVWIGALSPTSISRPERGQESSARRRVETA